MSSEPRQAKKKAIENIKEYFNVINEKTDEVTLKDVKTRYKYSTYIYRTYSLLPTRYVRPGFLENDHLISMIKQVLIELIEDAGGDNTLQILQDKDYLYIINFYAKHTKDALKFVLKCFL
jgi:hypothetical protein